MFDRFLNWVFHRLLGKSEKAYLVLAFVLSVPGLVALVAPLHPNLRVVLMGLSWCLTLMLTFVFAAATFVEARRVQMLRINESLAQIQALRWQDFEQFVWALLQVDGYSVEPRGGSEADGGVDLLALRDGKRLVVQCKHYQKDRVGVRIVREAAGTMLAERADGAILVTAGQFTPEAQELATRVPVQLVDGAELYRRLTAARDSLPEAGHLVRDRIAEFTARLIQRATDTPHVIQIPSCQTCGIRLHICRRNDGALFWGCRNYKKCCGGRNLTDAEREVLDPYRKKASCRLHTAQSESGPLPTPTCVGRTSLSNAVPLDVMEEKGEWAFRSLIGARWLRCFGIWSLRLQPYSLLAWRGGGLTPGGAKCAGGPRTGWPETCCALSS